MTLAQSMLLGDEPLVFLDEPEAHLHPPQARVAGKNISERAKRSQVFIATHSIELLRGLLQGSAPVVIIRLSREEMVTTVATLGGEELMSAWSDPLVRYSGALSGLMHKGVVICESEGDCLYYEVALDYLRNKHGLTSPHDLLFVYAGGKGAAQKLVPALRGLKVPVCVLTDFDMLRTWDLVKILLPMLGGAAQDYEQDWRAINDHLSRGKARKISEVAKALGECLAKWEGDGIYDKANKKALGSLLNVELRGWDEAKEHGLNALKSEPLTKAKGLLEELSQFGLTICPFGQLESFHREGPAAHGPGWVAYVIEHKLYENLAPDKEDFILSLPSRCVMSASSTL